MMTKGPKPLAWIFNASLAGAFFVTVFVPFWLITIPARRSAWCLAFSQRYLYGAFALLTKFRLWKHLPMPRTSDTKWLFAFGTYAAVSVLFAGLFTATASWRRTHSK
jgi:hypothetical protein